MFKQSLWSCNAVPKNNGHSQKMFVALIISLILDVEMYIVCFFKWSKNGNIFFFFWLQDSFIHENYVQVPKDGLNFLFKWVQFIQLEVLWYYL